MQANRLHPPCPRPWLLLLAALLLAAHGPRVEAQTRSRPNILWISNEDMSPRIGPYGDRVARTPTLDALARQSIRFSSAFTTAPVCAPSRAAIITGMWQNAIGAQHMRTSENTVTDLPGPYLDVPPFYVKAFPEYLRAAGYYTSNNYKTDYQFGEPVTVWDEVGTSAHWRNRPDKSQPFFAVFNLMITHESQLFGEANRAKPRVTDPARVQVPPYYPDTPGVREEIARFYDRIADMDTQVGQILKQLDEDGLTDNTIVFYWSDHGDAFPRSKRSLYDSGLRVPLMIRWPKALNPSFPAGTVNDQLVSFIDLAPTVLALAGVDVPMHMQGRVLVGPKAQPEPQYIFAARDRMDTEYDMIRGARDKQYLYVRNFQPELPYAGFVQYRNQSLIMQDLLRLQAEGRLTGPQTLWMQTHRPPEELYDVKADPSNIHNLAADPAQKATLERMRKATTDWMARIGDQGLINEAEMIQRMWPGGVQPVTAAPFIVKRGSTPAAAGVPVARDSAQSYSGAAEVEIYVPTQGASVTYTTDTGPNARWKLYTGPFRLQGALTIRAKAIRYGYKESAETRATFTPVTETTAR
jgi:N-sulfoglucosamine sulfohydrolase